MKSKIMVLLVIFVLAYRIVRRICIVVLPNCILDYTFILLLGYPGFKSGSEGNSISRFQHSYCRNIWKWIYCITRSFVQRDGERDLFVKHCEDHLCHVLHRGASHVTSPAPYACGEGIRVWGWLFFLFLFNLSPIPDRCLRFVGHRGWPCHSKLLLAGSTRLPTSLNSHSSRGSC